MVREGMMLADRYEIISRIGAGGMSDVYKAKDHKLNRFVAVKILKREFSDNTSFVAKFRTEAQSAAGLTHPNIVNVYDVGEEYGLYYIVMELVEGITLKHYIEKKLRLSVKEATSIAIQMAMGLEAAHGNHVIHRDVKPQNIIISKEGKVKVTDFGIARAATNDTITSNVMGSVHYTSPEQARGGYSDEKSDIYSLGIVLFEMVTGRVPFDGETTVAIAIKQIQDPMPNPRNFVNDIPVSVEHIIYKCCEKNPSRRYTSMTEVITDLKHSLVAPNEDFVKFIPSGGLHGQTKLASNSEMDTIKRSTGNIDLGEEVIEAYERQQRNRARRTDGPGNQRAEGRTQDGADPVKGQRRRPPDYPDNRGVVPKPDKGKRGSDKRDKSLSGKLGGGYDGDAVEEEDDMDPRLQKLMTALGVIAALIIVVIIIVLIGKIRGLSMSGSKSGSEESTEAAGTEEPTESGGGGNTPASGSSRVAVPEVRGSVFADAKMTLTGLGLVVTSENVPSESVEKGKVISIMDENGNPVEAGDELKQGSTVILSVSSGKQGTTVPSVVGMTKAEAKVTLANAGFSMKDSEGASETVPQGSVISQSPEGGSNAASGSEVQVVISTGAPVVSKTVPNVVGMQEIDAKATLATADIPFGAVTEEYSPTVPAGAVISQNPAAGTTADQNTSVSLVVSKGSLSYGGSFTVEMPPNITPGTEAQIVVTLKSDNSVIYTANVPVFPSTYSISGVHSPDALLTGTYQSTELITYQADTGEEVTEARTEQKTWTQDIHLQQE